jgi:hypothetical protein
MCDCLTNALEKITEMYPKWPDDQGKEVERFSFSDIALSLQTMKTVFNVGIDIKFKDQKKLGHTGITMGYCPLCGEKFEEGA